MFRSTARLRSLASHSHINYNGKGRPELVTARLSSRFLSTKPQAPKRPRLISSTSKLHASSRFASTTSAASSVPDTSGTFPDPTGGNAWDPNFQDIVSNDHVAAITPHIGYLKELGVDFGVGTTSMVQWIVEHIHVYGELPWAGTLVATAVLIRLLILPLQIRSADTTGRMSAVNHIVAPLQRQAQEARARGDQTELLRCLKEASMIRKRAGISLPRTFAPMLIQIPLAFGSFRLTRKMVDVGVPGLSTEGVLWFTDLTTASAMSPTTWILPAMTSVVMHFTMRKGGEVGSVTMEQMQAMGIMKWVFPAMSFIVTIFMPPAITLQFFAAACMGLLQTFAFSSNRFRAWLGIHPLIRQDPTAPLKPYTGTITMAAIDATINQPAKPSMYTGLKTQAQEWMNKRTADTGRLSKMEKRKADAYEKRRQQELKDEMRYHKEEHYRQRMEASERSRIKNQNS